jgi:hypothetical protein
LTASLFNCNIINDKKFITMTKNVLTIKFNYSIPTEELKKGMTAVAPRYSDIPGCHWKIWLINEDRKEGGGVYLFESAGELDQYLNSNLYAAVVNNPAYSNVQTNTYSVLEEASIITGAPLMNMGLNKKFQRFSLASPAQGVKP